MEVSVRSPFPYAAVPRLWGWMESFRGRVNDDFSPKSLDEFVATWGQNDRLKTWGVYRDGELGGFVSFEKWTPVLGTCHTVFKRAHWGHATTVPALVQVADEIFQGTTSKISMCVFADNQAVRGLLGKLGSVVEGVYKRHTMRDGKLVDMVALALFREGFYASTGNRSGDRRDLVARGRDCKQAEDADQHHDAHAVAGVESAAIAAHGLLPGLDGGPVERVCADPPGGAR